MSADTKLTIMAQGLTSQLDQILKNTTGAKNKEAVPLIATASNRSLLPVAMKAKPASKNPNMISRPFQTTSLPLVRIAY